MWQTRYDAILAALLLV